MSIDRVIRERKSVFTGQMSGEQVPHKIIERLLDNANWAPNHYHTEPWRFRVYSERGLERLMLGLAEVYKNDVPDEKFSQAKYDKYKTRIGQVSHAITISVNLSHRPDLPEIEEVCATACAVQNIWLTLVETAKYGGYWSSGNLVYTKEFGELINLGDDEICLGIFYVGTIRPDISGSKRERGDWQDKVQFFKN